MAEATLDPSESVGPRLLSKVRGAFVGLAYGDALGWPQEFQPKTSRLQRLGTVSSELRQWSRNAGGRFYSHREMVRAGDYSDDTQLTLAVARSRLLGDDSWWQHFTRTELPLWMLYERGGGGATKRAASSWLKSTAPWDQQFDRVRRYFDAGGNGVAMRILAHAVRHACSDDSARMVGQVVLDGTATHGHPRALVGAALFAFVTRWLLGLNRTLEFGELICIALNGANTWGGSDAMSEAKLGWLETAGRFHEGDYTSRWKQVSNEMVELLTTIESHIARGVTADDHEVLKEIGCFGREKGSGTVSAAAAIYLCSRYAAQPERGILSGAFASGADTDTIAAMTGCLLGALAGINGLPKSYKAIQDREYILSIASRFVSGPMIFQSSSVDYRPVIRQQIDKLKNTLSSTTLSSIDLDGVRTATVVNSGVQMTNGNRTQVHTWRLRTDDGQTLYVKRFTKTDSSATDSPVSEPANTVIGISQIAKALLLLMHPLTEYPDSRNSDLLTLAEYNQFANYLQEQGRSPSDLLGLGGGTLVQGSHSLDPSRIGRLLSRRSALEAALRRWESNRIWVICRADQLYPKRLKDGLRRECPPLLFGSGEVDLLSRGGLAIIGSDATNVDLIDFAQATGRLVAEGGSVLVSGGFTSIERAALRGARDADGGVVTHFRKNREPTEIRQAVPSTSHDRGFVAVSDRDPTLSREVGRGSTDRRVAPLLADAALVVEAESKQGYPWSILADWLRGSRPGRVFVRASQNDSQGLASLRKLGALDWEGPQSGADRSTFFDSLSVRTWNSPNPAGLINSSHEAEPTSQRSGRRSDSAAISRVDGATLKEFETFLVKIWNGPLRVDDIAETLGVEQWVADGLIRRLVAEGVLEEQSSTGRYRLRRVAGA